jgi:hypothetical protein
LLRSFGFPPGFRLGLPVLSVWGVVKSFHGEAWAVRL